jgi:hypothetical protein
MHQTQLNPLNVSFYITIDKTHNEYRQPWPLAQHTFKLTQPITIPFTTFKTAQPLSVHYTIEYRNQSSYRCPMCQRQLNSLNLSVTPSPHTIKITQPICAPIPMHQILIKLPQPIFVPCTTHNKTHSTYLYLGLISVWESCERK